MASPGRPKGSLNKVSAQAKENVIHVFEQMGGVNKMTEWAKENMSEFYRLYGRLLPTDVQMTVMRDARELEDDELNHIAAGGSNRTAGETQSAPEPGQLH